MLTRLIASIRPRNSLISVIGRLVASTTPTAGGPAGAGWVRPAPPAAIVTRLAASSLSETLARHILHSLPQARDRTAGPVLREDPLTPARADYRAQARRNGC